MHKGCKVILAAAFAGMMLLSSQAYAAQGYNLVPVTENGENTITKYEFDMESNKFVPQYYRVDLKQTSYGDGSKRKNYEWVLDENNNFNFTETGTSADGKTTINYFYEVSDLSNRLDASSNKNYGDLLGIYIENYTSSFQMLLVERLLIEEL